MIDVRLRVSRPKGVIRQKSPQVSADQTEGPIAEVGERRDRRLRPHDVDARIAETSSEHVHVAADTGAWSSGPTFSDEGDFARRCRVRLPFNRGLLPYDRRDLLAVALNPSAAALLTMCAVRSGCFRTNHGYRNALLSNSVNACGSARSPS